MSIGKRIKCLRKEKGYTQENIAKRIGVAIQTIYKYENEIVTNIPLSTIEQLANILECTPAYLMGWEEAFKPNRIKELRISKGITQHKLAEILGVSAQTVTHWEKGDIEPHTADLSHMADYFGVSVDYLLGREEPKERELLPPNITEDFTTFPVIGEVAAGYDMIADEDWTGDTIDVPNRYLRGRKKEDFFVLRVHGDSMYPLYHDGDAVLILRQTTLNRSGDVGVILYGDESATLKKVDFVPGEDWLRMVPINPSFQSVLIEGADLEECRILGIPVLLIREIASE